MKGRIIILILITIVSFFGYYQLAYSIERTDHLTLFSTYGVLVLLALIFFAIVKKIKYGLTFIFLAGLLFRLTFSLVQPSLSDDFFRFTWDGELSKDGISPFALAPKDYDTYFEGNEELKGKYKDLYHAKTNRFPNGTNSPGYYSIYPTVSQTIFWVASYSSSPNKGNLIAMRFFLLLAEVISFFVLRRLLISQQKSSILTAIYWLNPLVIIEIIGNLHFEGIAITFILITLLFIAKSQLIKAGIILSLAIATKLNPIFFLGATFTTLKLKNQILFSSIALLSTFILFTFYMDLEGFLNFKESFGLYFAWFSFNSGVMSFIKITVNYLTGYNIISTLSLIFPFITLFLMGIITFRKKKESIAEKLLLLFFIYFSFSPIVHPWYITVIIPLAILSNKIYPLVWSVLIFLTYSAYKVDGFQENHLFTWATYLIVFTLFFIERRKNLFT